MASVREIDSTSSKMDGRDRLIVALYAQLKAERETREAPDQDDFRPNRPEI